MPNHNGDHVCHYNSYGCPNAYSQVCVNLGGSSDCLDLIGQVVEFNLVNAPGEYLYVANHVENGADSYYRVKAGGGGDPDSLKRQWRIVGSISDISGTNTRRTGSDWISFESMKYPGMYLSNRGNVQTVDAFNSQNQLNINNRRAVYSIVNSIQVNPTIANTVSLESLTGGGDNGSLRPGWYTMSSPYSWAGNYAMQMENYPEDYEEYIPRSTFHMTYVGTVPSDAPVQARNRKPGKWHKAKASNQQKKKWYPGKNKKKQNLN